MDFGGRLTRTRSRSISITIKYLNQQRVIAQFADGRPPACATNRGPSAPMTLNVLFTFPAGFAFRGATNSSFRSPRCGTAVYIVAGAQNARRDDDSVWEGNGRPIGRTSATFRARSGYAANVVIVTGLICRCGAWRRRRRRRYGCGSPRIRETVEMRLCSGFRRTGTISAASGGHHRACSVTSGKSIAWRELTRRKHETRTLFTVMRCFPLSLFPPFLVSRRTVDIRDIHRSGAYRDAS